MTEERFSIVRTIRKGPNTGEYEAEDRKTGRSVNVRRCFLSPAAEADCSWHQSFLELGKSITELKHPNLLDVNEAGFDEDGPYISCELVEVKPILTLYPNGLDNECFFNAAEQVLSALSKIHQRKLIHGAVVLDSLQVIDTNGEPQFLIYDLGMHWVKSMLRGEAYSYQDPIFTPPEFLESTQPTSQSDVYMFGHLLYCLWAGVHPLAGMDMAEAMICHKNHDFSMIHKVRKNVPIEWSKWIDKLTSADLSVRPVDANAALACMPRAAGVSTSPQVEAPKHDGVVTLSPVLNTAVQATRAPAGALPRGQQPYSSSVQIASTGGSGKGLLFGSLIALLLIGGFIVFKMNEDAPTDELAGNPIQAKSTQNQTDKAKQVAEVKQSPSTTSVEPTAPQAHVTAPEIAVNTSEVEVSFWMERKTADVYKSFLTISPSGVRGVESIIYPHEQQGQRIIQNVSKIGQFSDSKLTWDFVRKGKLRTSTFSSARFGFKPSSGWKITLVNPSSESQSFVAALYFLQADIEASVVVKVGDKSFTYEIADPGRSIVGRMLNFKLDDIPADTAVVVELTYSHFKGRAIGGFAGFAIGPTK